MHRTTDPMANGTMIAFNGLGMLFAYPSFISICKNSIKSRFQITLTPNKGNYLTCFLVISINEPNFVLFMTDNMKFIKLQNIIVLLCWFNFMLAALQCSLNFVFTVTRNGTNITDTVASSGHFPNQFI